MSTNELNSFLNSFSRPVEINQSAWNHVLAQSKAVWDAYLNGDDWKQQLNITCKESYLMLVDPSGRLIVKDESLLNYVQNEQVRQWIYKLQEIAIKALSTGKYDMAERYFGKLIKLDPRNAKFYFQRAIVRVRMTKSKLALEDLNRAIELNPSSAKFYLKRAEVYRLLDVDHKAMSDMNTAIKLQPKDADAFELRGKFRTSLGDRAGGRLDMLKAAELREPAGNGDAESPLGVAA